VAIAVFDPRLMILPSDFIIRFNPLFPGKPPAGTHKLQFQLTKSSSIKRIKCNKEESSFDIFQSINMLL
jgi:hypothetical protein